MIGSPRARDARPTSFPGSYSYRPAPAGARARGALLALLAALGLALSMGGAARAATTAPVSAEHGMVVTSQADATRAGVAMLAAGGNAIDAAVAAAFALAVSQPNSTGIGGGCVILIRLADGRVVAVDGRETAPAAATRDMYVGEGVPERASVHGALAVATPGMIAGLDLALRSFGTKALSDVLQPAIAIAELGFQIGPYQAALTERAKGFLPLDQFPETARVQFEPLGSPVLPGRTLVQKDLARTLSIIAEEGPSVFYEGFLAEKIAAEIRRRGGILNEIDLARYRAVVREPVRGGYRGFVVYGFPPPSSGGMIMLEMLNVLEGFDLAARGAGSSSSMHVISEAMKLAYADRAFYGGDADFVEVPVARLISKDYAAMQRARIDPPWFRRSPWDWFRGEMAITVRGPGIPVEDHGTVHLSVTDSLGNAVGITSTINTPWGSGITVPGTGIVLNNEMNDFAIDQNVANEWGLVDTRGANAIEPLKRPLSSMSPTILVRDGKPFMVAGSNYGSRIITATMLAILNVVDYGMDVAEAVAAPRFHHQWSPDELVVEPATPADVVDGLRARGHTVQVSKRNWAGVESIVVDPETGVHFGGADPRRDGLALGY